MPSFPLRAARLIRAHDIIGMHTPLLEAGLVGLLCRILGKPMVITHHADLILPPGAFNRVVDLITRTSFALGAWSAKRIVAYTQDFADHSAFLAPFKRRIQVIYPPVEMPDIEPDAGAAMKRRLGLTGRTVVGFAGRFVEEKRPDRLLRALPLIAVKHPEIAAVFAGEYRIGYENYYNHCHQLIESVKDCVLFLGLIRDEYEMAAFYQMCDVLVLPSARETFGLVQVEAMLFGTPVIANAIPGAREPVRITGMGEVVDCENPQTLATIISRVLENKADYVKPREFIETQFSLDRTTDEYEALLREILESRRPFATPLKAAVPLPAEIDPPSES